MLVQAFTPPVEPTLQVVLGISEVAALYCPANREGKVIISGLGAEDSYARTAIEQALYWFKKNHLKREENDRPLVHKLGLPYIDMDAMRNLGGDPVDIVLHVPPTYDATFLAPSMVLALIAVLWRLPPLRGWSAAGGLDISGNIVDYPKLGYYYVKEAKAHGIHTMLVSEFNAETIIADMAKGDLTPEGEEVTIRGFKDMMAMVGYVIDEGWLKEEEEKAQADEGEA